MKTGRQSLHINFSWKITAIFFMLSLFIPVTTAAGVQTGTKGLLMNWEISKPFNGDFNLTRLQYPRFFQIFLADWQTVTAEENGYVDITKIHKGANSQAVMVFARCIFKADKSRKIKLLLGCNFEAALFLNNTKRFQGKGNKVDITVEKGLNEIFLMVKSGTVAPDAKEKNTWGFTCSADVKLEPPRKDHSRLTKVWETEARFLTPESVIYDEEQDQLYVSSFDVRFNPRAEKPVRIVVRGDQSLTRIADYNVSSGRASLLGLLCIL